MPIEMSIQQAAEYFNVSAQTVRRRLDTGQLLGEKVKGRWVIKVDTSAPPQDTGERGGEDSTQDIDEVSTCLLYTSPSPRDS